MNLINGNFYGVFSYLPSPVDSTDNVGVAHV